MKCKNCDNFTHGKCIESFCYGSCDADSTNKTVEINSECTLNVEDLCCIQFDGGEREWVLARSEDEALEYYEELTGIEVDDLDAELIKDWHDLITRVEKPIIGWKEATFLEVAKEDYNPSTFEPYIISTTCY